MTCDAFFLVGVLAALTGLAASIVALTAQPGLRYVAWMLAALLCIIASAYLTVPWLIGYTDDCVTFNYKLSLAKMPPVDVQPFAVGSGADDSHSVRSHTYRVGWFGNGRIGDIRD
jgi:hypothetical protein